MCAIARTTYAAPDTTTPDASPTDAILVDPAKRSDPAEFRGRENYTTADEVLAWVPRVAFFPVYLTTEYLLRVPLDALAGWMDRHHVIPIIQDILDPTPNFHWNPAVALDFGSFVALGAEAKWSNAFVPGHDVSGQALSSGVDGYRFAMRDSWKAGPVRLGAYGGGSYYQNRNFYGFGPNSIDNGTVSYRTYYADTVWEAFAFQSFEYRKHVFVELAEGYRNDTTGVGYSPSIGKIFDAATVPGYGAHMDLLTAQAQVKLDTRRDPRVPSSGARLRTDALVAHDVSNPERTFGTLAVDGEIAAEISKPFRVLSLRGYVADCVAFGKEDVPFNYQSMLGFDHHYGFIWGRFRDKAAIMAELRYHHPVAYFVDMEWIYSVGNVFAQDFSNFDVKLLTSTIAVGLRTRETNFPLPIELLVGLGTSRFDEPFAINEVRVYLSTTEHL